jgi:DNA/RNA-binding domain of Phe-tRNA-synthetase-like protein
MKFLISPDIIRSFPELRIAIVIADNLKINEVNDDLQALKLETVKEIRKRLSFEIIAQHPHIIAWRQAYARFGVSPKKHPPTVENLLNRILKGGSIPTINTFVDSYLVVELEYLVPIGGYDLQKIKGDIYLRFSKGGEHFVPLGLPEKKEQTLPNEIIYCDNEKVLTRRWNHKDCDEAKITLQTKKAVLFIEACDNNIQTDVLKKTSERLSELIRRFNGGFVKWLIFDPSQNLSLVLE